MDLYLDYEKNRRRHGRKNRKSKLPIILGVLIVLIIAAAGIVFGIQYKKQKDEEARRIAKENQTVTIMFPEGYSIDMMAKRLEDKKIFQADEFLAAVKKTDLYKNKWIQDIPKVKGVKYRLEGFLYPDTYNIYKKSKPQDLVQKMLDNFEQKYNELEKSYKGKHSMYELASIASMIEREASVEEERPIIAGVIENRLAKKMKLQIDPTVLYSITDGMYDAKKVYYKDLKVDSPYNTYKNVGLPAGPICNPGYTAWEAAMNPEKHDYLYYRTDGSGKDTHVFTKTFEEHKEVKSTTSTAEK